MHEVRGVVARGKGEPVTIETILVPDPGPGEALVAVQACGVCHTDLHYREGAINDDFPFLLGHEAAGIVEAVGPDVTSVAPGDFVILNWRAVCGECRSCRRGQALVLLQHAQRDAEDDAAGRHRALPALGIGAFAEKTLVAAGQATKVDPAASPTAAGLLGCGVMAGLGAAMLTGNVQTRRLGRGVRLRRRRRRGDRRRAPRGRGEGDRGGPRPAQARDREAVRRDAHRRTRPRAIRSRRSRR